jgi:phosphatidylserine/phosphatidylglycerophosphate/cardiolipin synthase-like enzyme
LATERAGAEQTRAFVAKLSPEFLQRFVALLRTHETIADITRARIMQEVANYAACDSIASYLAALSAAIPNIPAAAVAFGIECALETADHDSRVQTVDLVWTGPESSAVSVRRSSAVLFELIDGAKSDLIVMSFASFRIPEAEAALHRAVERGVRLDLILETEEESGGRYHQFGAPAYGSISGDARVSYYSWAKAKRPYGAVLHAKVVVADGTSALITSANLTERGIDDNIEIGALIRGGALPQRLREHILSLIESGEFEKVPLRT